jgi:RHS repeat-associated protein
LVSDLNNNLTSVTDPDSNTTTYTYDAHGHVLTATNALGTTSFSYDADGNLTSTTDADGRSRMFVYDDLGRKIDEFWHDASGTVTNTVNDTYDKDGRLLTESDNTSLLTYTYDALGLVATVSNAGTPGAPTVVMTYTYDAASHVTQRSDTINNQAAGTTASTYNVLGLLTQEVQSGGTLPADSVTFTYNAAGQVTRIARFADAAGTQAVASSSDAYDTAGRLTGITTTRGTSTLAAYTVSYNADDQVSALTTSDGQSTYTFSPSGQLNAATAGAGPAESFTYDASGNRTGTVITIGADNTPSADASFTYTYDANGNLISQTSKSTGAITTYTYDDRNRLISVVTKSAAGTVTQQVAYTYDLLDRLISRTLTPVGQGATSVSYTVYDGSSSTIAYQFSPSGTDRALDDPAVDQVLADSNLSGSVSWYLTDPENTVRDVINSSGVSLDHIVYGSFGNIASETQLGVNLLAAFGGAGAGATLDRSTGLVLIGSRAYDPAVGRFLQPNPAGFSAGDPNLYLYAGNDPVDGDNPTQLPAAIRVRGRPILTFGLPHPLGPVDHA